MICIRTKRVIAAVALLNALGACATVAPYERETLARKDMALDQDPDASAGEHHATAYREGATGAEGTSGGGCGCN